jgi:DNA-directed RNA polymerase specialized sigma subunit
MEHPVRRATKKKRISKKKVARRRVLRRPSKNEQILDIAETIEERMEDIRGSCDELRDHLVSLGVFVDNADEIRDRLVLLSEESDSVNMVRRNDVLRLLRVILNLDEDDKLIVDAVGKYIPLERPRVPLSQLQLKAMELYEKATLNNE